MPGKKNYRPPQFVAEYGGTVHGAFKGNMELLP
jgi:hypothetical protein